MMLKEPKGWYLERAVHQHEGHRSVDQTVEPLPHANGPWEVRFQIKKGGGLLTTGRGRTLEEAWGKALDAVLQMHGGKP